MRLPAQSALARYAVAVAAVALAAVVRLALDPLLGDEFPFTILYLAVLVAAGYGGLGPGLVATAVGGLLAARFLLAPRTSFAIVGFENWAGFCLYLAVGSGIAVLGGVIRRSHMRLKDALAEARQAEATRRHLAAIVESSDDAICSKDLDGVLTSWNTAAERLYGWSAAEIVGRPFTVLVPPDRAAESADLNERSRRGEAITGFETVRRRKDGSTVDVSITFSPVRDSAGGLVGTAVITRDVSAQKQALAALKASEARFAAVIQNAPAVVFVKDPAGVYLMVNRQFGTYAGRPVEDILGKTDSELFTPDVVAAFRKEDEAVLASGRVETFEEAFPYAGASYTFLTAKFPLPDSTGRPMAVCGIATDITARKVAEQRVAEEGRVAETLGRIGLALASELDLQRIVQFVTDETTRLTDAQFGAFFYNVLDERGESYTLYTLSGVPREKFERFPMPRNTGIFNPTFRGEGVVRLDDVTQDPRYGKNAPYHGMPEGHLPVRSYLAAPVVSRSGEVLGGLFFGHERVGVFTDRHERLVTGVAAQAAIAIDNARLYRQVQESEERFRQLAENIGAVFWLTDVETGRILYVSPAYEQVWGRPAAALLAGRDSFLDSIHPDDRDQVGTALATPSAVHPLAVEYRIVRPDGAIRWVADRGFPIRDAAGKVVRVAGIAEDVTARRAAEDARRSSENWLRLALDAGRLGVWEWDVRTNAIRWSDNLEPIHGLPPGGFDGTFAGFQKLIHPADRELVGTAINKALAERSRFDVEFRTVWPDGSVHWMTGQGQVFSENGEPARMVGVGLDVTDRKRREIASRFLAGASAALAALTDPDSALQTVASLAVPEFADWCAVDMADGDGGLRRVAVAHVDPAKVKLAHAIYRRWPPDPNAPTGVPQVIRSGRSEMVADIPDQMLVDAIKDPELLAIMRELGLRSYIGVPLTVRGKALGAITFIAAESGRRYDPTDLSAAEDLARRAAVAVENAQLYQAVREADRRKDEFLATLAHELRNPLAPVRNALYLLKSDAATPAAREQARAMMERQVHHLIRLVDDLLDVSRVMRGKVDLRKERTDVGAVAARAVETAQPLIDARRHTLTVNVPPSPVWVHADPVRLAQVVGNLLTNAAKYTDDGGQLTLTVERTDGEAVVRVRDTGIGIAPDMLPKVFDLFVQVETAADRTQGGLGIGLTLVKRLVDLHGGTVEAHSDGPGRGSEFVVRLPALRIDDRRLPIGDGGRPIDDHQSAVDKRRRVLVVDDHADAADSLALLLQMQGHEVRVARNGPEAVAAVSADPPEVVLLDLGMPGMDGYEVARRLRADGGQGVFLVALTGWGQEEDRRRTREAGFDHHLTKPADPDELRALLARPVQ